MQKARLHSNMQRVGVIHGHIYQLVLAVEETVQEVATKAVSSKPYIRPPSSAGVPVVLVSAGVRQAADLKEFHLTFRHTQNCPEYSSVPLRPHRLFTHQL